MIDVATYRSTYDAEYRRMRALGHGHNFASLSAFDAAKSYLIAKTFHGARP